MRSKLCNSVGNKKRTACHWSASKNKNCGKPSANLIDQAFERKTAEREKTAAAVSEHDKRVLDAAKALQAANASGDAQQIRAAAQALQDAGCGSSLLQCSGAAAAAPAAEVGETHAEPAPAECCSAPAVVAAAPKKLVVMRGDDRPGMKKTEPVVASRFWS